MDGVDVVYMPPLPLATITCRAKPDQDAGDFPASKYFCLFDLYSNKNTANDAGATANPGEFTNRCSGTHEAALPVNCNNGFAEFSLHRPCDSPSSPTVSTDVPRLYLSLWVQTHLPRNRQPSHSSEQCCSGLQTLLHGR